MSNKLLTFALSLNKYHTNEKFFNKNYTTS